MIKLTKKEKDFINKWIRVLKKAQLMEMEFTKILDKYDIEGDGESAGLLSNSELDNADQFEDLVNEYEEYGNN